MTNPKIEILAKSHAIIVADEGKYLQSYTVIIAFVPQGGGKTQLDEKYWDYSNTTRKYRNQFLGENKASIAAKIASGEYQLTNLNK